MTDLPSVTIVMTIYFPEGDVGKGRLHAAAETLQTWDEYLRYDGSVDIIISDDGSDPSFEREIHSLAALTELFEGSVGFTRQERHGVGASLNRGFAAAFLISPVVLYAVDDWTLTEPFDITPWVDLLVNRDAGEDPSNIGMVRLGPPHPDLTGTVRHDAQGPGPKGRWVLALDRHHFAFGHRPALYHQRMIDAYGWFDEDVNAYDCERLYSERFNAATEGPGIVLALPDPWLPIAEEPELELAHIVPGRDD